MALAQAPRVDDPPQVADHFRVDDRGDLTHRDQERIVGLGQGAIPAPPGPGGEEADPAQGRFLVVEGLSR